MGEMLGPYRLMSLCVCLDSWCALTRSSGVKEYVGLAKRVSIETSVSSVVVQVLGC